MEKIKCPCCGYKTIEAESLFDICEVCYWEDDPVQRDDPEYEGGANGISLEQARENFKKVVAISIDFIDIIRPSREDEVLGSNIEIEMELFGKDGTHGLLSHVKEGTSLTIEIAPFSNLSNMKEVVFYDVSNYNLEVLKEGEFDSMPLDIISITSNALNKSNDYEFCIHCSEVEINFTSKWPLHDQARGRLFQGESFECDFLSEVKVKSFDVILEEDYVIAILLTPQNSKFCYKFFIDAGIGFLEEWSCFEIEEEHGEDFVDIFQRFDVAAETRLNRIFCQGSDKDLSVITFEFPNVSFRLRYSDKNNMASDIALERIDCINL